jgi:hypothetical protein
MQSKFHRWWLGSCVAALLLASWAGGFSVAVTAVFVVIYLTGVTLVGSDEEADIGLAAEPAAQDSPAVPAPEPKAVPQPAPPSAEAVADHNADHDAQPYPDDGDEVEPASSAPVVRTTTPTPPPLSSNPGPRSTRSRWWRNPARSIPRPS